MKRQKQIGVLLSLAALVVFGAAGISAVAPVKDVPGGYVNLKVLPKHISSRELQGIMTDDFEDGLGVSCGFCHAPNKGGRGLRIDSPFFLGSTASMYSATCSDDSKYLSYTQ